MIPEDAVANVPSRMRRGEWLAVFALVLLALAWRLPFSASLPMEHVDEWRFSLPTAERIASGHALFYIYDTTYGAPVHEVFSALLFRWFGESHFLLRLPVAIFGAVTPVLVLWSIRKIAPAWIAWLCAILLAFPASAVAHYSVISHPAYLFALGLIALLQVATFRLDRTRTFAGWCGFGVLCGVAHYVFVLTALQTFASLAWLALRSAPARAVWEKVRADSRCAARWRWTIRLCAASAIVAAPVAYRYFTRRATYTASTAEIVLLALAAFFALAAIISLVPLLRAPRRAWLCAGVCTALFVTIPLPAKMWFARVEGPRLAAEGVALWPTPAYALKHLHEMPFQARLFLDRVLPALFIGRWDELDGLPPAEVHLTWKAACSAALLAAIAALAITLLKGGRWRAAFCAGDFVVIVPALAVIVIMFPSWQLHSDTCFRYPLLFLPGFYLLLARLAARHVTAHPRLAAGLLAAYVGYCGMDCVFHLHGGR